jgi:YgiT-type zinc finger domain-containing protein
MKQKDEKNALNSALEERLRQWHQENPAATFTDIEQAVDAELTRLRQAMVSKLAAEAAEETVPQCPECGQEMVRNGRKKRKVRTRDNEQIELEREQWRCLNCGMTLFPPGREAGAE